MRDDIYVFIEFSEGREPTQCVMTLSGHAVATVFDALLHRRLHPEYYLTGEELMWLKHVSVDMVTHQYTTFKGAKSGTRSRIKKEHEAAGDGAERLQSDQNAA